MGPVWVLSAPDGPHEPCYQGSASQESCTQLVHCCVSCGLVEVILAISFKVIAWHWASPTVCLNPLHTKLLRGNKNIYLHFMPFLHIDMTKVVEILPQGKQGPTYST